VKTGKTQRTQRDPKVSAFLVAGALGLLFAPFAALPYAAITLILGARATRLPVGWWPMIPVAFAMHHLTYWLAIVAGMLVERRPSGRRGTGEAGP
jgi:hypothetical protein